MTLPGQAESLFHSCTASHYIIFIMCGFQHSCPSLPPQYTVLQRTILYLLSTGGYDCTLGAIPLYHMGWVGLYQGFMHTHGVHKNPLCLSYPTIPHGMGGTVPGILTYTHCACKS